MKTGRYNLEDKRSKIQKDKEQNETEKKTFVRNKGEEKNHGLVGLSYGKDRSKLVVLLNNLLSVFSLCSNLNILWTNFNKFWLMNKSEVTISVPFFLTLKQKSVTLENETFLNDNRPISFSQCSSGTEITFSGKVH